MLGKILTILIIVALVVYIVKAICTFFIGIKLWLKFGPQLDDLEITVKTEEEIIDEGNK